MRDSRAPKSKSGAQAAGSANDNVCAGHALGFPLRSELGFLPIENLTLDVFRCICDVYATGSAQPWEIAMKISEERLGAGEGPVLVALVTGLLRSLRLERKLGFSYLSIGCQHVSPDELTVTALLKSARARDDVGMARGIALALDNAEVSARTSFAVRSLASLQSHHVAPDAEADGSGHEFESQTAQAVYLH
jgi:hypothetical protein